MQGKYGFKLYSECPGDRRTIRAPRNCVEKEKYSIGAAQITICTNFSCNDNVFAHDCHLIPVQSPIHNNLGNPGRRLWVTKHHNISCLESSRGH